MIQSDSLCLEFHKSTWHYSIIYNNFQHCLSQHPSIHLVNESYLDFLLYVVWWRNEVETMDNLIWLWIEYQTDTIKYSICIYNIRMYFLNYNYHSYRSITQFHNIWLSFNNYIHNSTTDIHYLYIIPCLDLISLPYIIIFTLFVFKILKPFWQI